MRESLAAWQLRVPQIRADWDQLEHVVLPVRLRPRVAADARRRARPAGCPAAGMPWFMTVFGRDTIITCLQTLMFGPELAAHARSRCSPSCRRREDDPSIDAEPGKIVHELRRGKAAQNWFRALLRHGRRDAALPRSCSPRSGAGPTTRRSCASCKEPALRGARAGSTSTATATATASSSTSGARRRGLENQSWKDSGDSQRFHDGSLAPAPIAPVEVQGYVYDAKRRMAELAREVWRDRPLAERLEREADRADERFDEAFWIDARGGYYVARARRREAAGRLALLEHRPPALERDRARRARRRGRRPADGRRSSGRAGACGRCRRGRRGLQPALVPQRHRSGPTTTR